MAITRTSSFVSVIPIKRSKFIGDSLITINTVFTTLSSEFTRIIEDKIPLPTKLTHEPFSNTIQPTPYKVTDYTNTGPKLIATTNDRLTFDENTLSWVPSAVAGYEASLASAWVTFRAPVGVSEPTINALLPETKSGALILNQLNVKEVRMTSRGVFEIYFEKPLLNDQYAVFASGYQTIGKSVHNVNCRYIDKNKFAIGWQGAGLPYGSTISAVVFSSGGLPSN